MRGDSKRARGVNGRRRRSAELHSAVSQNCILQGSAGIRSPRTFASLAECNSAIRQTTSLRYDVGACPIQALLHFQSSGAAHRPAFTGLWIT